MKNGTAVKASLTDDYIIELDVCGRNLIGALQVIVRSKANNIKAVNIDPNYLKKDVWYTYRILVHATDAVDIAASTTTVMRKLRDSDDDFEVITMNNGYTIGNAWGNAAVSMGVVANTSYGGTFIKGMDTTTEKMAPTNTSIFDGYTAILDTHYQLDNISIYGVGEMTKGEWEELIGEDFDGENQKYFTTKYGAASGIEIITESEEKDNNVIEIKFGDNFSESNLLMYDNVRIGQGAVKTDNITPDIALPNNFMVEFDMCAVNPVGHMAVGFRDEVSTNWYAIKINPNKIEKDVWYTYRIYTESTDEANSNKHVVMCKPRDTDEAFRVLMTELEYHMGGSYVNSTITFGVIAQKGYAGPYINGMDTTLENRTAGADTQPAYTAITKSVYRLDNIRIYGRTLDSYEMNGGFFKKYDMETADTLVTNATCLTPMQEENGNAYIKYALPSTALDGQNYLIAINATKDAATVGLPEKFIFSFDANNTELGYEMTFEIYGDGDGVTEKALPRYTFYLKSTEADKGIWYSYKVVATGTPGEDNVFDFEIYRKERNKDEAWKLLNGAYCVGREGNWPSAADYDYGEVFTLSSKGVNRNTIRFGDSQIRYVDAYKANEAGNANIGGVWLLDNFEITDAASVSGNVNLSENVITAELNICAASACKPVVAIYDGDTFVGAGIAEVTADGKVQFTAEGFEEGYTAKLFVWDSVDGSPMLGSVIDITNML